MESMNEYKKIMENPLPTQVDKEKLEEFLSYMNQIQAFKEFAPPISQEHYASYEHEMEILNYLNSEQPNPYYEEQLQKFEKIAALPSLEEQKAKEQQRQEEYTLKLQKSKEKHAGFTNASILIFVTINLGLFLASLLLLLK